MQKALPCEICGKKRAQLRRVSRTYGKGKDILVIENIPVITCPHCGESYLDAQTLHEIERIKLLRKNPTGNGPRLVRTKITMKSKNSYKANGRKKNEKTKSKNRKSTNTNDKSALRLVNWIIDKAIAGVPPLSSAKNLADEYLLDNDYVDNDGRVNSLINWETSKNFTSGFITGLGGVIAFPVAIPAALGASWAIQARMAGAIAVIYGHKLKEDRVRTLVLLSLVGDSIKNILKEAGIKIGNQLTKKVIEQIPGKVLIEINKRVGFRLLTKAGEKGAINFTKAVPFVGGIVGGSFDAYYCRLTGKTAKNLFQKKTTR